MPKLKKRVGIKKDYDTEFRKMQEDLKGVPRDVKLEYYKSYYKQIAKAADSRLLKLERLSKKKGYGSVLQFAYRVAQYDIHAMFGEDVKRFNRKQPDDLRKVYKNIRNVLRFLALPTSTRTGIEEAYSKRAETINKKYGTNVNWVSIATLFQSTLYKKLSSKYASKTALRAIGILQQKEPDIVKALKNNDSISVVIPQDATENVIHQKTGKGKKNKTMIESAKIADDAKLEYAVNNILKHYKKDLTKLYKGM